MLRFANIVTYLNQKNNAHSALSPALGHEPFGSELKAELLGPNGGNQYVTVFINRGAKEIPFNTR